MNDKEQYTVYKLTLANGVEMEVVSDEWNDASRFCLAIGSSSWYLFKTLLVNSVTDEVNVVDVAVRTEYIVSMQKVD